MQHACVRSVSPVYDLMALVPSHLPRPHGVPSRGKYFLASRVMCGVLKTARFAPLHLCLAAARTPLGASMPGYCTLHARVPIRERAYRSHVVADAQYCARANKAVYA